MFHSDSEGLFEPYAPSLRGDTQDRAAVRFHEAICNEMTNRGTRWELSNGDNQLVRGLYAEYQMERE